MHFHRLIHAADLERQVAQREPLIAVQHDIRLAKLLKACGLDGDTVRPRGHLGEDESSRTIGHRLSRDFSLLLDCDDFGIGDRSLGGIQHGSRNGPRNGLRTDR